MRPSFTVISRATVFPCWPAWPVTAPAREHHRALKMRSDVLKMGVAVRPVNHRLEFRGKVNDMFAAGYLEVRYVDPALGFDMLDRAAEFTSGRERALRCLRRHPGPRLQKYRNPKPVYCQASRSSRGQIGRLSGFRPAALCLTALHDKKIGPFSPTWSSMSLMNLKLERFLVSPAGHELQYRAIRSESRQSPEICSNCCPSMASRHVIVRPYSLAAPIHATQSLEPDPRASERLNMPV